MEFYIAKNKTDEKIGPHSIFRIVEMLRDKSVSSSDLGWTRGQEEWLPLKDIPAFESAIRDLEKTDREEKLGPEITIDEMRAYARQREEERSQGKIRVASEVQPFTRFWARMLDYTIVLTVILLYADLPELPKSVSFSEVFARSKELAESEQGQALAMMLLIGLSSWTLLEGVLISLFKTTPGKAIFSIKVTEADGSPIPVLKSIGRAIYTFILGCGMGMTCISQLGMAFSFFRLLATGKTPWDQHLNLKTNHTPMGLVRILLAVGAFFALITALELLKFT